MGRSCCEGPQTALRRAVPFGSYCVATLDPESNLLTNVFNGGSSGEESHAEAYGEVLARTYFEEDVVRLAAMHRERRSGAVAFRGRGRRDGPQREVP